MYITIYLIYTYTTIALLVLTVYYKFDIPILSVNIFESQNNLNLYKNSLAGTNEPFLYIYTPICEHAVDTTE